MHVPVAHSTTYEDEGVIQPPTPIFGLASHAPRGRTQAHEKDLRPLFVCAAVGIGIGIAFGIEIAIDGHFDSDADTDSDPGISRYHPYFRSRN